jgi:hypothetical protein
MKILTWALTGNPAPSDLVSTLSYRPKTLKLLGEREDFTRKRNKLSGQKLSPPPKKNKKKK